MRIAFILATFLCLGFSSSADAQTTWAETPGLLTADYVAEAYRGTVYQDPIAVRAGQQTIYFDAGVTAFIRMEVSIDGGSWQRIYDGSATYQNIAWTGVPPTPDEYNVKLRYYRIDGIRESFDYRLLVVPPAQRAFSDGAGNSMVLWEGATSALDSPLLVVEGIDADNINVESHYYALGSTLFGIGRSRGADVLILNLYDGGRDLRLNADVVKRAIQYLNQIKTGNRKLDVAGVSMGGVIARYTLADMEADGATHNVGYFVSIDAPQQGAVVDGQLLNWMYNPPWYADGKFDVPQNVISMAGKQLLQYNPFDTSNPKQHDLFYNELNALNGDGYPHLTTENIGVSFGISASNSDEDEQWLEIAIQGAPNSYFFIEEGSPEASAGSLLPEDITNLGGSAVIFWVVDVSFGLVRTADPTFIPYDSALDRVSGQSRFDHEIDAVDQAFPHNVVPTKVVEPLLTRLGYPEPPPPGPLSVSVSGPTSLNLYEQGTWTATVTGGTAPYASLAWAYRYPWGDPEPCDPCIGTMAPDWGDWVAIGLPGLSVSHRFTERYARAQVRLLVTDAAGTTRSDIQEVTLNFARPAGETDALARGTEGRGTEDAAQRGDTDEAEARSADTESADAESADALTVHASAASSLPVDGAVLEAFPNPLASATTLRFGLSEASEVRLAVYDALGREVARLADGPRSAGWHTARFEAAGLPSGLYVVRLTTGAHAETIPVTVLR